MKTKVIYAVSGQIMFAVLGFLSVAILARALDVASYGTWVIYLTIGSLFEMMRSGLLQMAVIHLWASLPVQQHHALIGSAWRLGLLFTALLSLVCLFIAQLFPVSATFRTALLIYPLLALVTLPQAMAQIVMQARHQIKTQVVIKALNLVLCTFVFLWVWFSGYGVYTLMLWHVVANLLVSLLTIISGVSGLQHLRKHDPQLGKQMFHFGKFSIGTLIGTNLLKSTDTFLLALLLGSEQAAIYSIPLKLTEIFEILLRSLIQVMQAPLAAAAAAGDFVSVKRNFQRISGLLTLLYVPGLLVGFFLAETLIVLFSGDNFVAAVPVFRLFLVYGLLLPIDRMTGVTLDCLGFPQLNMYKVMAMFGINLLLDLIFICNGFDMIWVALGTCLTTACGTFIGIHLLHRRFDTGLIAILNSGFDTWKNEIIPTLKRL